MGYFPIIGLTTTIVIMIVGFIIYKKCNEKFINGTNPLQSDKTGAMYEKMLDIPTKPVPYNTVRQDMLHLPPINQFDTPSVSQQPKDKIFGVPMSNIYIGNNPGSKCNSDFVSETERNC